MIDIKNDKLLRWPVVQEITGISRTTVWRLENVKQFPARVKVSKGITAWKESEIMTFIDSRERVQGESTCIVTTEA